MLKYLISTELQAAYDAELQSGLEAQKRLREQILRRKEMRRQIQVDEKRRGITQAQQQQQGITQAHQQQGFTQAHQQQRQPVTVPGLLLVQYCMCCRAAVAKMRTFSLFDLKINLNEYFHGQLELTVTTWYLPAHRSL